MRPGNRSESVAFLIIFAVSMVPILGFAQDKPDYLEAKPLSKVVNAKVQPVAGGKLQVPVITWGGDVATVLTHSEGILKSEGVEADLFLENNFQKQV